MANRRPPDVPKAADPAARAKSSAHPPPRVRKSGAEMPAPDRVTPEARRVLIAESAYLRAERRGFAPGYEAEDWLAAEAEVDALLKAAHGGSPQ